jgi:hypothetical protein
LSRITSSLFSSASRRSTGNPAFEADLLGSHRQLMCVGHPV